jgi:hypothetical protein
MSTPTLSKHHFLSIILSLLFENGARLDIGSEDKDGRCAMAYACINNDGNCNCAQFRQEYMYSIMQTCLKHNT